MNTLIYLFFFVIGVPASIPMIITNAPLLFVFTLIIALTNMIFCFVFGCTATAQPFAFSLYNRFGGCG